MTLQPDNDISAYTYERTLIMEQRNEMLKQMRLTNRQKKGDVQHLLARSFSRKVMTVEPTSPSQEVSIPVPQIYRSPTPPMPNSSSKEKEKLDNISIGELSTEPRIIGPSDDSNHFDLGSPGGIATSPEEPLRQRHSSLNQSSEEIHIISRSTPSPKHSTRRKSPTTVKSGSRESLQKQGSKPSRRDSLSSSDSDSCPEEQSVRTPLLDTPDAPGTHVVTTLPTNSAPSIKRYDEMFAPKREEEEIPLGGSAENLVHKP